MDEIRENYIDKTIWNLLSIHPLVSKSLRQVTRSSVNLNIGSLYLLTLLSHYEMLSMSEIGNKLSMPKPHVTMQVDKLIAENMAERLNDPKDRRIILIRLTEKGREDFKMIKQIIGEDLRQRIQSLDEAKIKLLSESTQNVRDILVEIMIDSSVGKNCMFL
jgi:DNA-binding MarR family transcriptional regulator